MRIKSLNMEIIFLVVFVDIPNKTNNQRMKESVFVHNTDHISYSLLFCLFENPYLSNNPYKNVSH